MCIRDSVKAVLDLEEAYDWSDYVVEAQVTIDKNEFRDVGLIFRGTQFGNNADEYYGYYAGIGKNGIVVGFANGSWNQLIGIPHDLSLIHIWSMGNFTLSNSILLSTRAVIAAVVAPVKVCHRR